MSIMLQLCMYVEILSNILIPMHNGFHVRLAWHILRWCPSNIEGYCRCVELNKLAVVGSQCFSLSVGFGTDNLHCETTNML